VAALAQVYLAKIGVGSHVPDDVDLVPHPIDADASPTAAITITIEKFPRVACLLTVFA
jgi:hypothetical protein